MFLKKSCIFILALLLCAVLTTACGGQNADKQQDGNNNNNSDASGADSGTPGGDTTESNVPDAPVPAKAEKGSSYILNKNMMEEGTLSYLGTDSGDTIFYIVKGVGVGQFVYIDSTGKELFHINGSQSTYVYDPKSAVSGSDGTVALSLVDMSTRNSVTVILNRKGEVVWKSDKTVTSVSEAGDGYYFVVREVSTFDENYKFLEIIDQHGEIIFSTEAFKQEVTIKYLKEDMFIYREPDGTIKLYSAEKRASLDMQFLSPEAADWAAQNGIMQNDPHFSFLPEFRDGAIILNHNASGILMCDKDARVDVILVGADFSGIEPYWGEASLVIKGSYWGENGTELSLWLYDFLTASDTCCEADYLDKIWFISPLSCGRVVAYLWGADGNDYFSIFDKDWNEILGPTPGKSADFNKNGFRNNRLYIKENSDLVAYDTEGNVVFRKKGYSIMKSDSSFPYVTDESGNYFLIDENGELLYTEVDNSKSVDITAKIAALIEN